VYFTLRRFTMLSFSARSAFALAVALSAAGCSNPVGPEALDPVAPAFNASAANSGKQKCETTEAAKLGAINMVANPGHGHHVENGMGNAAPQGIDGMWVAVAASSCP
jgi:hypothetical protein